MAVYDAAGHSKQMEELFLNDLYSDVTLVVEGQALKAHRAILAVKSEYFRSLLTSGMKESHSKEVVLNETPIRGFRPLLRYIYTGRMSVSSQDLEVILEVVGLANKYCFTDLEKRIWDQLDSSLTVERVCRVLETALLYKNEKNEELIKASYTFLDKNSEEVLEHPSFLKLPQHLVTDIFSRDSFAVPEIKIFKAAQKWLESNTMIQEEEGARTASSDAAKQILSKVRLELIPLKDLVAEVRPSGLVSQDILFDAIESSLEDPPKNPRMENVATKEHGTKLLCGKNGASLLNKNTGSYASHTNLDKKLLPSLVANGGSSCKLCEHHIGASGIVVMLGRSFIINHIAMKLRGKCYPYSYIIDVSVDGIKWDRVIDYSSFFCHSMQNLFFPQHTVKFIRIIGTGNTSREFCVISLEAFYNNKADSHDKANILVPSEDVAWSAGTVIKGADDDGENMLSWDSGYSHHDIDKEPDGIVLQLTQPHILDSMRFQLDTFHYSYVVEVSNDYQNWERVWDRSGAISESGWQNIAFSSRPVVFIRIKGTGSSRTDTRSFYVENFECPSSVVSEPGKSA